jgi:hypothetical protein
MVDLNKSVDDFLASGVTGFRGDSQDANKHSGSVVSNSDTPNETKTKSTSSKQSSTIYTSSCLLTSYQSDDSHSDKNESTINDGENTDLDNSFLSKEDNDNIDRACTAETTKFRGSKLSNEDKLKLRKYCEKLNKEVRLTEEMKVMLNKTDIHAMPK